MLRAELNALLKPPDSILTATLKVGITSPISEGEEARTERDQENAQGQTA